ncbi:hypothetical protein FM036_45250 [Nostoc sp. HG1]|nr:hypothetical protein [Nostoc sp. HG1]
MDDKSDKPTVKETAQIIRSMIQCEEALLNNRISWLMTIQGLLFAGLGFAWDKKDAGGLIISFALLGILVSISARTVLPFYSKASRDLIAWWDDYKPSDYTGPDVVGFRASRSGVLWLIRPWRALPFIFIAGWLLILVAHLIRN